MTTDREPERDAARAHDGQYAAWEALDGHAGRLARGRTGRRGRPPKDTKDLERDEAQAGERGEGGGERAQLDNLDILAFILAFFQLLLPPALVMIGVLVLLYLLLRLWAGG